MAAVAEKDESLRNGEIAAVVGELCRVYRERLVEMALFKTFSDSIAWKDLVGKAPPKVTSVKTVLPTLHADVLAPCVSSFTQGYRLGIAHRPSRTKADVLFLCREVRRLIPVGDVHDFALDIATVLEGHIGQLAEPWEVAQMKSARAEVSAERAAAFRKEAAEASGDKQ